jgi:hypothetical protein
MSRRNEVSIPKLNPTNHSTWRFNIEPLFMIEGIDITQKIDNAKLNGIAIQIIRQSVAGEIIPHIMGDNCAHTTGSSSNKNMVSSRKALVSSSSLNFFSLRSLRQSLWGNL